MSPQRVYPPAWLHKRPHLKHHEKCDTENLCGQQSAVSLWADPARGKLWLYMLGPGLECDGLDPFQFGACSTFTLDPATGLPSNRTDGPTSIELGGMWEYDLHSRNWAQWDAAHSIQNFSTCGEPPGETTDQKFLRPFLYVDSPFRH